MSPLLIKTVHVFLSILDLLVLRDIQLAGSRPPGQWCPSLSVSAQRMYVYSG